LNAWERDGTSPYQECSAAHSSSRACVCCPQPSPPAQIAYVSIRQRQHTSAYVSICQRQHTSAYVNVSISQHTSTSAYVSIRQRQHTSAYVYVSIRQHASTSANGSICQHTSAVVLHGHELRR
jgi:hypothetical protein